MLKIFGIVFILTACCLYGNHLTQKAEESLNVTEALLSFVMNINALIKTARMPLRDIFSSYENVCLRQHGFSDTLNNLGLAEAIKTVEKHLSAESIEAMYFLEKNIGGIDIENQRKICEFTESKLSEELEDIKKNFSEKKRMYRILPVLAGVSVIILIV